MKFGILSWVFKVLELIIGRDDTLSSAFGYVVRGGTSLALAAATGFSLWYDYELSKKGRSLSMKSRTHMVTTFVDRITIAALGSISTFETLLYRHKLRLAWSHLNIISSRIGCPNFRMTFFTHVYNASCLTFFTAAFYNKTSSRPIFSIYLPYYILQVQLLSLILRYHGICLYIDSIYRSLNERLEEVLQAKSRHQNRWAFDSRLKTLSLSEIGFYYCKLREVVEILNTCFGFQLLATMFYLFIRNVITPYISIIMLFYLKEPVSFQTHFNALCWFFKSAFHLLIVVWPPGQTKNQAWSLMVTVNNRSWEPASNQNEMKLFKLILEVNQPIFSVCGLYNISWENITSVVGSITTYLVILINFQNSE